jgi:rubrerythrin
MSKMQDFEFGSDLDPSMTIAARKERVKHEPRYSDTWMTYEESPQRNVAEYGCNECGAVFYARIRSKYSPSPTCPVCGCDDMLDWKPVTR